MKLEVSGLEVVGRDPGHEGEGEPALVLTVLQILVLGLLEVVDLRGVQAEHEPPRLPALASRRALLFEPQPDSPVLPRAGQLDRVRALPEVLRGKLRLHLLLGARFGAVLQDGGHLVHQLVPVLGSDEAKTLRLPPQLLPDLAVVVAELAQRPPDLEPPEQFAVTPEPNVLRRTDGRG